MRIKKSRITIINLIAYVLFLLPLSRLDLYTENYSTLSLDTRGYFYLLFLGILIGMILSYETYFISNKKYALLMFISMLLGIITPHHVPYNLQGNLHLLFAYTSSFLVACLTYINIFRFNNIKTIYVLTVLLSILLIFRFNMVTCISEVILMSIIMLSNLLAYIKTSRD